MNIGFVLDCSMTMAWCFEDEATQHSTVILDRLRDETALVPAHWPLEVVDTLATAERRARICPPDSDAFIALIADLDIQVDTTRIDAAGTLRVCRECGLTSYDAAYLDLAFRLQLPLATLDRRLQAAAETLGVPVLGRLPA